MSHLEAKFSGFQASTIRIDVYRDQDSSRRAADDRLRPIIRVTIVKMDSADASIDPNTVADSVVKLFQNGTIHAANDAPIVHVQRTEPAGAWTCWFNRDGPLNGLPGGDIETTNGILAQVDVCEEGMPNGVHCRTVSGVDWIRARDAGQVTSQCSLAHGIHCLTKENPAGCEGASPNMIERGLVSARECMYMQANAGMHACKRVNLHAHMHAHKSELAHANACRPPLRG